MSVEVIGDRGYVPAARAPEAKSEPAAENPHSALTPHFPNYINPAVRYDNQAGLLLLQFRDQETGDVKVQYPPEKVVREYRQRETGREDEGAATKDFDGGQPPAAQASATAAQASAPAERTAGTPSSTPPAPTSASGATTPEPALSAPAS